MARPAKICLADVVYVAEASQWEKITSTRRQTTENTAQFECRCEQPAFIMASHLYQSCFRYAMSVVERDLVPDFFIRAAIRAMLQGRLKQVRLCLYFYVIWQNGSHFPGASSGLQSSGLQSSSACSVC